MIPIIGYFPWQMWKCWCNKAYPLSAYGEILLRNAEAVAGCDIAAGNGNGWLANGEIVSKRYVGLTLPINLLEMVGCH